MADYLTSTTTSTSHLSPNRKRTRESRSSNHLTSSKSAAVVATATPSSIEVMDTTSGILPSSVTQPRSSIHSVQNGLTSIKTSFEADAATSTGHATTNGVAIQQPQHQQQQQFNVSKKVNRFLFPYFLNEKASFAN